MDTLYSVQHVLVCAVAEILVLTLFFLLSVSHHLVIDVDEHVTFLRQH